MDLTITLDEVAMLLGQKELALFQLNKQIAVHSERSERLLKQKDELFNENTKLLNRLADMGISDKVVSIVKD